MPAITPISASNTREISCPKSRAFAQQRSYWIPSAASWPTQREMSDTRQLNASFDHDQRLMSLDALRGFDMFWIIGGVPIINGAADLTDWNWLVWLSGQMHHTEWHGFTFYD